MMRKVESMIDREREWKPIPTNQRLEVVWAWVVSKYQMENFTEDNS